MQVYNANKFSLLLFQHKIYDLELGFFEVLEKRDFCDELQHYLNRLFTLGHKDILIKVLKKVGTCVTEHKEQHLRAKALQIVTEFADVLRGQKDKEIFKLVVKIVAAWLRGEQNHHPSQVKLLNQIETIVRRMVSLQLWQQVEPLVAVSRRISSGTHPVDNLLQKQVSKLHRKIAAKKDIQDLVQCFIKTKDPGNAVTGDLLLALMPHSSEAMIHGLFKCGRKQKRLEFLRMIPQGCEGVLPILIEKLKDRQPWYVVRNSVLLIGALGDADIYPFARPFLNHPDSRVQREVILCIVSLGGEEVVERLIGSFHSLNDDVKALLIELLQPYKDSNVQVLFLDILEQRVSFEPRLREELIRRICSSGKLAASKRTITTLQDIVEERESLASAYGATLDAAKASLKMLQQCDNLS